MNRLTTPGLRRVQARTTATAMVGVVLVVLVAAVLLVRLFEREQIDRLEDGLRDWAEFVDRSDAEGTLPETGEAASDGLIQYLSADAEVLYASDPLVGQPPLVDVSDRPTGNRLATSTVDGDDIRAIVTPFREGYLVFGTSLADVDDAVDALVRSLLLGLPLLTLGVGIVIWLIVGRTLRPVDAAMRRERQLIDDAGHDLRTPLAGVRALLETEPDGSAELERNRADALASLARLEATVEDLLVLSQVERERPVAPVDLDEIVLQEAQLLGHGDGPTIDTSGVSGGQVVGSRSELERMTENLLANGLRHAEAAVAVSVREDDGRVVLVVDDDGPGIPAADRDRVFERFTRLDASRTAQSGGSGLGLAIVRDVVTAHGGSVTIGDAALGGASFRVVLPAST